MGENQLTEFLHELVKKREEHAYLDAMISSARDPWASEEVMEPAPIWQQELLREMQRQWLPPREERPF